MRAVIQRVKEASVDVDSETVGEIEKGLLLFLGIESSDGKEDIDWLVNKVVHLRVFEDQEGRMNRSVLDIGGNVLVISQFTLYGNLKKGTRPSFNRAAPPEVAIPLYETFKDLLAQALNVPKVPSGVFGADMQIAAHNDGPVTLILDTRQRAF